MRIVFGDDCLIGWSVTIIDGDGHFIMDSEGKEKPKYAEITIGDHVWIASDVTILKESAIGNDSVVAAGACITRDFSDDSDSLIGGTNRILAKGISWKK